MSEKKDTLALDPETMALLDAQAKASGTTRDDVLRMTLSKIAGNIGTKATEEARLKQVSEAAAKTDDPLVRMMMLKMMEKPSLDLGEMLALSMLREQQKPQILSPQEMMMFMMMAKQMSGGDDKAFKEYLSLLTSLNETQSKLLQQSNEKAAVTQTELMKQQMASSDKMFEYATKQKDASEAEARKATDEQIKHLWEQLNTKPEEGGLDAAVRSKINDAITTVVTDRIEKGLLKREDVVNPQTGQLNMQYLMDKGLGMFGDILKLGQQAIAQQGMRPPQPGQVIPMQIPGQQQAPTPAYQGIPGMTGPVTQAPAPIPGRSPVAWQPIPSIPDGAGGMTDSGYGPNMYVDPILAQARQRQAAIQAATQQQALAAQQAQAQQQMQAGGRYDLAPAGQGSYPIPGVAPSAPTPPPTDTNKAKALPESIGGSESGEAADAESGG